MGDAEIITCRPADLIEPELDKYREEVKSVPGFNGSEEDVLSYALFPQVATKFFASRLAPEKSEAKADENAVREFYVDDCSVL